MKIKKQEVAMYGLIISTDECFSDMCNGGKKLEAMVNNKPVVYQDPNGQYQMFLFLTPEERNTAYNKAKEMGFESAAICAQMAYVDAKYLKEVEHD